MNAVPNTTGDILGGTTVDELGDTVDDDTVIQADVIASVQQQTGRFSFTQRSSRRVDDRLQNVRSFTIRLPHGTAITTSNRFRDAAGRIFVIDTVTTMDNAVMAQDVLLNARLVTT